MRSVFRDASGGVRNGWKILGCLALTGALLAALSFVQGLLPKSVRWFLPGAHWAFAAALLASWACVRWEREPLASLGLKLDGRWVRDMVVGTSGGTALLGSVAAGVWLAGGFELTRTQDAGLGLVLRAAWMMWGAALFEEVLFRGYVFQRLIRGVGERWAQGVVAVLFCLAHPFQAQMSASTQALAMLNTFLAGLLLGLCYLRTRSLALPVGVHLGWNWAMNCLGFSVSGNSFKGFWTPVYLDRPEWLTGGEYGLEGSVIGVVLLLVAVVAMALWKGTASADVSRGGKHEADQAVGHPVT
ncbi:CPBP family intramembrane metalloprotease [Myxococcus sp. K38C18041901]|uniref:CPBP family intramembrane glutamic endopeptidase n=1 Tax=Myxococcus guangdongensis TaxID=2906760 RepID=UPI0020A75C5E|nr:CPBP family intramembrane glutamic endopeptidase [Myxococcus guangdongensis]MCP3063799.1 CPBP family intramembrane metalloprotease [Myxococcus guangdongensis]